MVTQSWNSTREGGCLLPSAAPPSATLVLPRRACVWPRKNTWTLQPETAWAQAVVGLVGCGRVQVKHLERLGGPLLGGLGCGEPVGIPPLLLRVAPGLIPSWLLVLVWTMVEVCLLGDRGPHCLKQIDDDKPTWGQAPCKGYILSPNGGYNSTYFLRWGGYAGRRQCVAPYQLRKVASVGGAS